MPIPSEPGWYWWRATPTGEWVPALLHISGIPQMRTPHTRMTAWVSPCEWGDAQEWGPRIPGRARLAALEELAAKEPLGYDALEFVICCYCHAVMPNDQPEASFHKATCPWQRAQERADDAT